MDWVRVSMSSELSEWDPVLYFNDGFTFGFFFNSLCTIEGLSGTPG